MRQQRSGMRDPLTAVSTSILFILVTLTMSQVILRTVFDYPLIGAEELARYFLICIIFIGTPIAAREGLHISMTEIQTTFPQSWQTFLRKTIQVGWLLVFGFLTVSASLALINNINNRTVNLGIPFYIFMAPTVIGFTATAVISGRQIFSSPQIGTKSI